MAVNSEKAHNDVLVENMDDSNNLPPSNNLKSEYERHQKTALQAKEEYMKVYRAMAENLRWDHFETFANILLERDNCVISESGAVVDSIKEKILKHMEYSTNWFWENFDVVNGITSLEMLKDNFKKHEGIDWKITDKLASQRTLPMRVRLKASRYKFLQKQLDFQRAELEEICTENIRHREIIQRISENRNLLKEKIERRRACFQQVRTELLGIQAQLLETSFSQQQRVTKNVL